jgi:hypothetical protein
VLGDDIVARGGAGGDDHGEFVGVLDLVHMRVILYPDGAESLSMEDAVPSVVYLSKCRGHVAGGVAVGCGSGDGAGRRVAHANDDARAVILTGARGSFCSGLDLRDGEDDVGGGGGGLVVLSRDENVSFVHASRGASTRLRRRRRIVDFRTDRRLFGK